MADWLLAAAIRSCLRNMRDESDSYTNKTHQHDFRSFRWSSEDSGIPNDLPKDILDVLIQSFVR
jgi:hypothetical protein